MKNEETEEVAATSAAVATSPSSNLPSSDVLRLLYVDSIPRENFERWLRDKTTKAQSVVPANAESLRQMDSPTKERHDIGYISNNFAAWKLRLNAEEAPILPSFDEVKNATTDTKRQELRYEKDGLVWRSDYFVRVIRGKKPRVLIRRLVLHFPNDGFFYVEESLLPILASGHNNERHLEDAAGGWAYLDKEVWTKLTAFEEFARDWFGYGREKKLQRQILYNDEQNRMDICMRCPETSVSIEFSFEPGFPVPEVPDEFWF